MVAPAHIQAVADVSSGGSLTPTVTLNGVQPGSTLALLIHKTSTGTRQFNVYDDTNGQWQHAITIGDSRCTGLWYCEHSAAGDVTITIEQSGGSPSGYFVTAVEFGPSQFLVASGHEQASNTAQHHCAEDAGINVPASAYIFSGGTLNASGGNLQPHPSAMLISAVDTRLSQYRQVDAALASERSTWTSSTWRTHWCVSAVFVAEPALSNRKHRRVTAAHQYLVQMRGGR